MNAEAEMTLGDYAAVLGRRKWIVLSAVLLAALAAIALTAVQTPVYSTSADVLVQPRGQDGLFDNSVVTNNDRTIQTEIQVVEGEVVRQRVQDTLGLDTEPPQANASSVGQTDVISIAVRDENASNARTYADAYAAAYIAVRREQSVGQLLSASAEVQAAIDGLQTQLDALDDNDDPRRTGLITQLSNFNTTLDQLRVDAALRTGGAAIIKSAPLPTSPVEPTPVRTVTLAAVVGLLIGLGAAFLIDYLDDKVRDEDQLAGLVDRPVLAVVPVDPPPDQRPIAISQQTHEAVEAYRGLRTNLQFLGLDRSIKVVQVTSSMAGEGKTTTSANLAVVLAQAGHRVALVDADLRRPRVHEVFGISQTPGFTDMILGEKSENAVNHVAIGEYRLSVYTSGSIPSNPSEVLSGRRVRQLLTEMGGHYDYVVVDSAPVLPVSDSVALSGSVDGVLVVAQAGRVTTDNVLKTFERLDRVSAPILGLVLNQASRSNDESYAYGGYGSYSTPSPQGADIVATQGPVDQRVSNSGHETLPQR